jgi:adenosylhomocysteine nucleosidase
MTACCLIVGMTSEARIARRSGLPVAVGGGTPEGAREATQLLLQQGATSLVSFGLAGGLDPALRPGDIMTADAVRSASGVWTCDAALNRRLGVPSAGLMLAGETIVATAREKMRLHRESGAVAVDLESGAVAEGASAAGIPFAVLRAICDPAERDLPRAAVAALDAAGRISAWRLMASLLRDPRQVAGLIALGRDAALARKALLAAAEALAGWRL